MPYITNTARKNLANLCINSEGELQIETEGELNYLITKICVKYLYKNNMIMNKINYKRLNDIIGVLECAKLEFYRRMVSPYEDTKCKENGDVFSI